MQHKLLINGELVSGEGEKQPVYNPATGDVLLEIAEASAEQVDAAVRAADAAFAEWGQTTPKVRAECLLKLADVIEENGQVLPNWSPVIVANRCIVRSMMKSRRLSMFSLFRRSSSLPEWSGGR